MQRLALVVVAAIALSIAFLYAQSLHVLPFADDWLHIARAHEHGLNIFFAEQFFRPFERIANAINYQFFEVAGPITIACNIATLLLTAIAVFNLTRRIVPADPLAAYLAAGIFVAHPGNAASVIQIDTLSQCLAALFGVTAVRVLVFDDWQEHRRSITKAWLVVMAAFLSKETTVGAMFALPLVIYWRERHDDAAFARRKAAIAFLIVATTFALYIAARLWLSASITGDTAGRYAFDLRPLFLLRNLLILTSGSLYFGDSASSLIWRLEVVGRFGMAISVVIAGLVALGLAGHSTKRNLSERDFRALLLLWLASTFPALLLGRVSEQYLPGLTPFVAVVVGCGLSSLAQRFGTERASGIALAALVAIAMWSGFAIHDKQRLHEQLSQRTWSFVKVLAPLVSSCHATDDQLLLAGDLGRTNTGGRAYSVFSASNGAMIQSIVSALRKEPQLTARLPAAASALGLDAPLQCSADVHEDRCQFTCTSGSDASATQSCRLLVEDCSD